jgi:predicted small lipoprotein YifL
MRVSQVVAIAMLSAAGTLLTACGQKGPLYLPDQGGEVVTRPGGGQTQSSPSPESAPQPSTQTPPQTKPEDQKKEQAPR